jgi:hypothetical protein
MKDDLVEHENDTVVTTRRVIAHEVNVGDEDAVFLGAARDGLEDDSVGFFTHCEVVCLSCWVRVWAVVGCVCVL